MTLANATKQLMDAITDRTISFLDEEVSLQVNNKTFEFDDLPYLKLKSLSSLISIGGKFKVYIVFSFDKDLIFHIFKAYTQGLELVPEDQETDIEETAGEIINIVIGNALTLFQSNGELMHSSPPITIVEAKRLIRCKNAKFIQSSLDTSYGAMTIFLVGLKELFDDARANR